MSQLPVHNILGADGRPLSSWTHRRRGDDFALPHVVTFASIVGSASKTYYHERFDEAMRDGRAQALAMEHDCGLQGPVQERKLATACLNWHLEVPDEKDPWQKLVRDELQQAVRLNRHVNEQLTYWELDAIWRGRSGVQYRWEWRPHKRTQANPGRMLTMTGWTPVNGDKIGHTYNGIPYILVHAAEAQKLPGARHSLIHTTRGTALLLDERWRERFEIHAHEIYDADYFDAEAGEARFGVGIRSRLYWWYFLQHDWLADLSDFLKRVGLGVNLWYYESGNPTSEEEVRKAAESQSNKVNILVPRAASAKGGGQGVGMERVEVPTGGSELLVELQRYADEKIERFVVGQSLSSKSEGSGLGGSNVADLHADTKSKLILFDARNHARTRTGDDREPGLVYVMKKWTYPWADFPVMWVNDVERPESKDKLDAAKAVWEMGVDLKADEVRSFAGLSKPADGDELVQSKQQQDTQAQQQQQQGQQQHELALQDQAAGHQERQADQQHRHALEAAQQQAALQPQQDAAQDGADDAAQGQAQDDTDARARNAADVLTALFGDDALALLDGGGLPGQPSPADGGPPDAGAWVPYYGANGGRGWRNTITGAVVYGDRPGGPEQFQRDGWPDLYARWAQRAPKGGVTINGRFYRGGSFVPAQAGGGGAADTGASAGASTDTQNRQGGGGSGGIADPAVRSRADSLARAQAPDAAQLSDAASFARTLRGGAGHDEYNGLLADALKRAPDEAKRRFAAEHLGPRLNGVFDPTWDGTAVGDFLRGEFGAASRDEFEAMSREARNAYLTRKPGPAASPPQEPAQPPQPAAEPPQPNPPQPQRPRAGKHRPAVADTVGRIEGLLSDPAKATPEEGQALTDTLLQHTNAELQQIKQHFGIRGGKVKADLVARIKEKMLAGQTAGETATENPPQESNQAGARVGDAVEWSTIAGEKKTGTLVDIDNNTGIVRTPDGKEVAVAGADTLTTKGQDNGELLQEADKWLRSGKLYPRDKSLLKSAVEAAKAGDASGLAERLERVRQTIAKQDATNARDAAERRKNDVHRVSALLKQYPTVEALQKELARIDKDRRKGDQTLSWGGTHDSIGTLMDHRRRVEDAIGVLRGDPQTLADYPDLAGQGREQQAGTQQEPVPQPQPQAESQPQPAAQRPTAPAPQPQPAATPAGGGSGDVASGLLSHFEQRVAAAPRQPGGTAPQIPIHELRAWVRQHYGPEAASRGQFDGLLNELRKQGKVDFVPVTDMRDATPQTLADSIPGEGRQTFFYLEPHREQDFNF